MPLLEIALLAIASMFWPLLLVVVVVALESSRPARILVWFYIGGFIHSGERRVGDGVPAPGQPTDDGVPAAIG